MKCIVSTYPNKNDAATMVAASLFMVYAVRASHKYGFNVDDPETLGEPVASVCVDGGKKAGVGFVMADGEIKCLCGQGGVLPELLALAIAAGGTKLNFFEVGDKLYKAYEAAGFKEIARVEYNPLVGNVPSWAGHPDVVYMALDNG